MGEPFLGSRECRIIVILVREVFTWWAWSRFSSCSTEKTFLVDPRFQAARKLVENNLSSLSFGRLSCFLGEDFTAWFKRCFKFLSNLSLLFIMYSRK